MKRVIKSALVATIPVLSGYIVLGFGFGLLMRSSGFGILLTVMMSLFIYAGSMQYAAVGLLTGGASLITVAVSALMINARHLFYGISMLDRYKKTGGIKSYLIFGLTDETYSLVCVDNPSIPESRRKEYYFFVTFMNHFYWVAGSFLGAVAGGLIKFSTEGIEFALTALFLTVFVEQGMSAKNHIPAIIGVSVSVLSLLIFGADNFLIPAMAVIAVALCLYKGGASDE